MELIVLNRHDLAYKDHSYIDDESIINSDIYLLQKSKFIVSKIDFRASIGDVLLIKNGTLFLYLGIIDTITKDKMNVLEIETYEFKALFNIDIVARNLNGSISDYMISIFNEYFIEVSDLKQRLPYLEIRSEVNISGELLFEENTIIKLNDLLEKISKNYEIGFHCYPNIVNGVFTSIVLEFVYSTKSIKLKYESNFMRNFFIKLNENQSLNKVTFIPKSTNIDYKETINYYLLKDNEITTLENNVDRFDVVVSKIIFYEDSDYQNLFTIAYTNLKSTIFSHKINFEMSVDNNILRPLVDIKLGDIIEFIFDNIVYKTIFSGYQLNVKDNFVLITLGEVRTKLTDKIKIIEKENSQKNSQSNSGTHKHNEYFSGYVMGLNLYLTKIEGGN